MTDQQPNPDFRREAEPGIPWSRVSGFAILYAVSAWLSFVLSEDRQTEATFWLPIGMTMGALMISPRAHWRYYLGGMLVGDLAFNWINGIWPWPHWFAVAAANVATVLTAAWAVNRWVSPRPELNSVRELFAVIGIAALSLVITSAVGAGMLVQLTESASLAPFWLSWFFSDLVGVILMIPLTLVWIARPPLHLSNQQRLEAMIMMVGFCTVVTGVVLFAWVEGPGLRYVVFPFVIWAGIRFGTHGVSALSMTLAILIGWFALEGAVANFASLTTTQERTNQIQLALCFLGFFGLIPAIVFETHARTMQELHKQRNLRQVIFDSEPECVKVIGLDGTLQDMNRAGLQILEVETVAEAREYGVMNFVEPDYRAPFRALMKTAFAGGSASLLFRVRGKHGTHRWLDTEASALRDPDGNITGLLSVTRDVTQRKETEEALRIARFTVDKANLPMLWARSDATIVDANASACALLGYSLAELRESLISDIDVEFDSSRWPLNWTELKESEFLKFPSRQKTKDGRILDVIVSTHFLRVGDQELICAFIEDVTAQKAADDVRRKNEEQLRLVFSAVGDGIVVQDRDLSIIQSNAAAERILGLTHDQIAGRTSMDPRWRAIRENGEPFPGEDHPASIVMKTGVAVRDAVMGVHKPSGELTWISINAEPLRDETGTVTMVVCSFTDTTASRALQEKVRQAQKMEVVGQLAGGVAHDFNNILTAMMLNLQLLETTDDLPTEFKQPLSELRAMNRRASKLTAQLLLFARQSVMKRELFELNDVTSNILTMLSRVIGEQVNVSLQRDPEPLWINGDAGMIDQVVMNLCVNARDAMPHGGRLTISTSAIQFDPAPDRPTHKVGHFACLTVSDNGEGMMPETIEHLFEPFFTTKEVGKGTGLGLATVHGIVEEHHGWIEVHSKRAQGSTFRVYFPAVKPAANAPESAAPTPAPATVAVPRGDETILLVEDEAPVRAVASLMLRRLGYHVLEANNASQALDIWHKHANQIHLVLTDMVMPGGMSGLELANTLRNLVPTLRVAVMSGYSNEVLEAEPLSSVGVSFMPKPFEFATLAETVRTALDTN